MIANILILLTTNNNKVGWMIVPNKTITIVKHSNSGVVAFTSLYSLLIAFLSTGIFLQTQFQ